MCRGSGAPLPGKKGPQKGQDNKGEVGVGGCGNSARLLTPLFVWCRGGEGKGGRERERGDEGIHMRRRERARRGRDEKERRWER